MNDWEKVRVFYEQETIDYDVRIGWKLHRIIMIQVAGLYYRPLTQVPT